MGVFIIAVIAIILMIAINRTPGKYKLQNSENLVAGSKVVEVTPYVKGTKQNKHYEVKVVFADGSSYCTDLGEDDFFSIRYNQQHLMKSVQEAINAHEEAALEQAKQHSTKQSSSSSLGELNDYDHITEQGEIENSSYGIMLLSCGQRVNSVTRLVSSVINSSFEEASAYVAAVPTAILEGISYNEAEKIKRQFSSIGAKVDIYEVSASENE